MTKQLLKKKNLFNDVNDSLKQGTVFRTEGVEQKKEKKSALS